MKADIKNFLVKDNSDFVESYICNSEEIRNVLIAMYRLIEEEPVVSSDGRIYSSIADELEHDYMLEISGGILSKNFDENGYPINRFGDFLYAFKNLIAEFILAKSKYDNSTTEG